MNWNNAREELCGNDLTADHAVICPCGPHRHHRHHALIAAWSDISEEAGGTARNEVFAPCISSPDMEAFLDIHVHGLEELNGIYFDVTVRHPGTLAIARPSVPRRMASPYSAQQPKTRPGIRRAPRDVL